MKRQMAVSVLGAFILGACGGASGDADAASVSTEETMTPTEPNNARVAKQIQTICDQLVSEVRGDLTDESFAFVMEESGVGSFSPRLETDTTTLVFDDAHACLTPAVKEILTDEYGIGLGTFERMESTRALDGELSASTDNATIYWTYHPDTGLDLIIERTG